ncbi:MAG: hypothetical protein IAE97_10915 [Chthoniobacterales bacterium]|nr:hypothetical protein [Chthoniobacterales bacterium]
MMTTVSLRLPDHVLEREKVSQDRGTTKSAVVRACLEESLAAPVHGGKETCYGLATDLAGTLKGLPRDLATNSKHMDAFGR